MLRDESGVSRMASARRVRDDGPMTEDSGAAPRRLARAREGRLITGVCAGLARYTRIDAIVYRVAFALLVLTTGIGIILYAGAFLLMAAPDGGPSKIERLGHRLFDGDTVLALLGAGLGAGALFGVAGALSAGSRGSGDGLAVAVVFALALFTARARGADLVQVARTLPDRVKGRPLSSWAPAPGPPGGGTGLGVPPSEGMVDLASLTAPRPFPAGGPFAATEPAFPRAPAPPPAPPAHVPPYYPPHPAAPRHRSRIGAPTLMAALGTGGVLYAAGPHRFGFDRVQVILAGALAVVAAGLFIGSWFGRSRMLVVVGAIMSLALASTSIAGDPAVARRTHAMTWGPADAAGAEQSHRVLIGEGTVDLTRVPLAPGGRLRVTAKVTLGVLAVKVPDTARVEVDGQAFLGDITVDRQITSGPRARVRRVLEPVAGAGHAAPVIELRIRSTVGDMEVTRVPA